MIFGFPKFSGAERSTKRDHRRSAQGGRTPVGVALELYLLGFARDLRISLGNGDGLTSDWSASPVPNESLELVPNCALRSCSSASVPNESFLSSCNASLIRDAGMKLARFNRLRVVFFNRLGYGNQTLHLGREDDRARADLHWPTARHPTLWGSSLQLAETAGHAEELPTPAPELVVSAGTTM